MMFVKDNERVIDRVCLEIQCTTLVKKKKSTIFIVLKLAVLIFGQFTNGIVFLYFKKAVEKIEDFTLLMLLLFPIAPVETDE